MAPQVVQYPRATSLTAHSSRATGVEVAAWAASLIAAPVGETFFAQHEAYLALCETKFALLTQKRRIWGVLRALGEFCHAYAANQLSRASLISPERCTAAAQQRSRKAQEGLAAVPAGGGEARPDNEPTRRATHQRPGTTGVEGAGGTGGRKRAWLRCPRAVAGPGWASRRRITTQHRRRRRCGGRRRVRRAQEGLAAVPAGGGGAWLGFETAHHHPAPQAPPVWRAPEGPEGTGGLRDRPLRAKLACGDLAGGRARRRPEHQRRHKHHRTKKPQNSS